MPAQKHCELFYPIVGNVRMPLGMFLSPSPGQFLRSDIFYWVLAIRLVQWLKGLSHQNKIQEISHSVNLIKISEHVETHRNSTLSQILLKTINTTVTHFLLRLIANSKLFLDKKEQDVCTKTHFYIATTRMSKPTLQKVSISTISRSCSRSLSMDRSCALFLSHPFHLTRTSFSSLTHILSLSLSLFLSLSLSPSFARSRARARALSLSLSPSPSPSPLLSLSLYLSLSSLSFARSLCVFLFLFLSLSLFITQILFISRPHFSKVF